jgi:FKBP-type peptidyl-prolyl cis-trans isomerase
VTVHDGFGIQTLKEGSGRMAEEGHEVLIYETTTYSNGQLVYTTKGMDKLHKSLIGGSQVSEGVDPGVRGMSVEEVRKLIVAPSLSKREFYPDMISPNSTLYYEIELVGIEK